MKLDRVTFTGADDSSDPRELARISEEHPTVEWGILFSGLLQGNPRYPSLEWLRRFAEIVNPNMRLSAHLCGRWVRDLVLKGDFSWLAEYDSIAHLFQRIQINFHGEFHRYIERFPVILETHKSKEFILQCDGINDQTARYLSKLTLAVPLFDTSGGAGILPTGWPLAWNNVYCGYAGGLGPENIDTQLGAIAIAAGKERIWIDMERRVRSEDDSVFDLAKVKTVLLNVEDWMSRLAAK